MSEEDKLRELARQGESALRTKEDAEQASRRKFEQAREAQRRHIAAASTTALGWLDTGDAMLLAPLLLVGVGTFLVGRESPLVLKLSLAAHVVFLALLVAARGLGIRGGAREAAWVASLPFPLEEYLAALGDVEGRASGPHTGGKSQTLDIQVRFKGDVPADAEAIFAGFDPKLAMHSRRGTACELSRADFPGGETNYPLHRYVRKLVPDVLVPLHHRTPLAGVRVAFRK
jgi:hypothetical protein